MKSLIKVKYLIVLMHLVKALSSARPIYNLGKEQVLLFVYLATVIATFNN